jgi:hypothetical protein
MQYAATFDQGLAAIALLMAGYVSDAEVILDELESLQAINGSFAQFFSIAESYKKTVYWSVITAIVAYAGALHHGVTGTSDYQTMTKDAVDWLLSNQVASGAIPEDSGGDTYRLSTQVWCYYAIREFYRTYLPVAQGANAGVELGLESTYHKIAAGAGNWGTLSAVTTEHFAGGYCLKLALGGTGLTTRYGGDVKYGGDNDVTNPQGLAFGGEGVWLQGSDSELDNSIRYGIEWRTINIGTQSKTIQAQAMLKASPGAELGVMLVRGGGDLEASTTTLIATGNWQHVEVSHTFNASSDDNVYLRVFFYNPELRQAGEALYVDNVRLRNDSGVSTYRTAAQNLKEFAINECYDADEGRFYWTSADEDTEELQSQLMGALLLSSIVSAVKAGGTPDAGLDYGSGVNQLRRVLNYIQNYQVRGTAGEAVGYDNFRAGAVVSAEQTILAALLHYKVSRDVMLYVSGYQANPVCAYGAGGKFGAVEYGQAHGGVMQAFAEQVLQWEFKGVGSTALLVILLSALSKVNNGELFLSGDST